MLVILSSADGCDTPACEHDAICLAINMRFVTHLCPVHLAGFLYAWMESPEDAVNRLPVLRRVLLDQ